MSPRMGSSYTASGDFDNLNPVYFRDFRTREKQGSASNQWDISK